MRTDVFNRLRAEYLEMPGLRLTVGQAQRLCGIERASCQRMLDALVDAKLLYVAPNGAYARLTDGVYVGPQRANGELGTATTTPSLPPSAAPPNTASSAR